MTEICLVTNPAAGKGRGLRLLPDVAAALRRRGAVVEIMLSRDFADAQAMIEHAVRSSVDVLAVLGGDGMMHLGVNGCARAVHRGGSPPALGLIPAGTGDDLCRGLGLDPRDPVAAADIIATGSARPIDVIDVGDRFVATVVASGFDALVNRRANVLPWPKGSLRYPIATFAELRTFTPLSYQLSLDGHLVDLEAMLVAVGNTSSYGGGMKVCPDAVVDDGLLEVTIVHPVPRTKLLRLLPQMYSGRFVRDACVERRQAQEVVVSGGGEIAYGDGELIGSTPIEMRCRPRFLSVMLPSIR